MNPDRAHLLAAYDQQLRGDAELSTALVIEREGPLRWATFAGGRGMITYRPFSATGPGMLQDLIRSSLAYFRSNPDIREVEWKTRGHDDLPGLDGLLPSNGFAPEATESVMIGAAEALAVEVAVPTGVQLRQISDLASIHAMCAMQAAVFDDPPQSVGDRAAELKAELAQNPGDMQLWIAEVDGAVVSTGRMNPVRDSEFAGIWGGATVPQWRGRGIYRAITAARARGALAAGKTLINSDSTEYSRPILERYGFSRVTTTTPYVRRNWT